MIIINGVELGRQDLFLYRPRWPFWLGVFIPLISKRMPLVKGDLFLFFPIYFSDFARIIVRLQVCFQRSVFL